MHSFKSILCAVDTSAVASRVLRHAVGMAGAFGARLTVLSVSHGDLRAAEQVLRDQVNDAVPPGAAYPADLQVRLSGSRSARSSTRCSTRAAPTSISS